MRYDANSIEEYLKVIPKDRVNGINQLRNVIKANLAEGLKETFQS